MITTILVPTDGSQHARKAVELAGDIAAKYGSRVVLLHVLLHGEAAEEVKHMAEVEHLAEPEPTAFTSLMSRMPQALATSWRASQTREAPRRVLEQVGQQILEDAEALLRKKGVKQVETAIEDGNAVKRILEYVGKTEANLVVMGSRGLSDIRGMVLGSVSHKVSHLAPCTCMTVR